MKVNRTQQILDWIDELQVFSSLYESRVIAALINSHTYKTAAQLTDELSIPDSKIYPALNSLADHGLIIINDAERPKQYWFDQPEKLEKYVRELIEERYSKNKEKLEKLSTIMSQLWQPDDYILDNIAQLYRGNEVNNELARHIKLTKKHLFIFLSINFTQYDILRKYLPDVSHEDFRLEIVIPASQSTFMTEIEEKIKGKVKMRTSIWNQNSYIIRDNKIMMNMFHSTEDVVLLTNDELMVKNIRQCWDDPNCCTQTDLIQLDLPSDFEFQRVELS